MNKTEKKIKQLLDRIVNAESTAVVSVYEERIGELQLEKRIMQEKVANCGSPLRGFDESFRTAMDFLANPHELWASGRIEDRHTVMNSLLRTDWRMCVEKVFQPQKPLYLSRL